MKKSLPRLVSLLGLIIFGGLGLILAGVTAYILLTDGLDNLRGKPETGWAAGIAMIVYLPIAVALLTIAALCRKRYKKDS